MQDIEREDNIAGNHDDEEDGDDAIQQQFSHYLSSTTAVVSVAPWPSLSQYIFFGVDKRIDIWWRWAASYSSSYSCIVIIYHSNNNSDSFSAAVVEEDHSDGRFSIQGTFREGRASYLDMSSTTPMDPRVLDKMMPFLPILIWVLRLQWIHEFWIRWCLLWWVEIITIKE